MVKETPAPSTVAGELLVTALQGHFRTDDSRSASKQKTESASIALDP